MQNLRYIRNAAGLTQQELGAMVGTTNVYICNVEKGKHVPSILTADRIAKALGCSLDDLIAEPTGAAMT